MSATRLARRFSAHPQVFRNRFSYIPRIALNPLSWSVLPRRRHNFGSTPTRLRSQSTSALIADLKKHDYASDAGALQSNKRSVNLSAQPAYELTFTCKPCLTRSTNHAVSKQAYHHGSVLITCPKCKAKHVISDHLKIFSDKGFNIEEFLEKNSDRITKGSVEGDMEFWDDGSSNARSQSGV